MDLFKTLHMNNGRRLVYFHSLDRRWYFVLREFCVTMGFDEAWHVSWCGRDYRGAHSTAVDYFHNSLLDFARAYCPGTPRSAKHRQLCAKLIVCDRERLLAYVRDNSHKHCRQSDGSLVNVSEAALRRHFETHIDRSTTATGDDFVAVQADFFCAYLQTMHTRWQARRDNLQLSCADFATHLAKQLRCPFWSHLLCNLTLLEPIATQHLHGKRPEIDRDASTDDLLAYLETQAKRDDSTNSSAMLDVDGRDHAAEQEIVCAPKMSNCAADSDANKGGDSEMQSASGSKHISVAPPSSTPPPSPLSSAPPPPPSSSPPPQPRPPPSSANAISSEFSENRLQVVACVGQTCAVQKYDRECDADSRRVVSTVKTKSKHKRRLTQRDRIAVAADQKWKCGWCQQLLGDGFETDHIEEFHESGNDHHSNLWAICANCHNRKTEFDRRRKRPHVWQNYRQLTDAERETRRRAIIAHITN